jgi:hypothetical protein
VGASLGSRVAWPNSTFALKTRWEDWEPAGIPGQIDIYLSVQLLKGRSSPGMRMLDAGCGSGRNIV